MPNKPPTIKVGDRAQVDPNEDRKEIAGKWGTVLYVYPRTQNRGEGIVTLAIDGSDKWYAVEIKNIKSYCSQ